MPPIASDALDMVRSHAAWFLRRIKAAQRAQQPLITTLDAFGDDPLLVYACLWYAAQERTAVQFVPETETPQKAQSARVKG